ncbi:MAG: hypothetical protein ACI89L_000705 [Phycisphaerales bacterium]|jgi:hypothetical protein
MDLEVSQSMPLEPRPVPAEVCDRRVEPTRAQDAGSGFHPLPGTVPFDVYLEGSNRIARETDTFSLSQAARDASDADSDSAKTKPGSEAASAAPKNGWAKLGEVLTAWHPGSNAPPPPAKVSKAPEPKTAAVRHTGTGRLIDVIT